MNIESLNTILGDMIAHSVLYKIRQIDVVTSKMLGLMLTAALPDKVVSYIFVTVISR